MPSASPSAVPRLVASRRPRRALILYLLAIVGPTLALLFLGLTSVQRQRDALNRLTQVTERLRLQRVAEGIERRVADAARACLHDRRLAAILRDVDWATPEHVHEARHALGRLCDSHEVCAGLIVTRAVEGGLPLLDEPLPRDLQALPDTGLPRASQAAFAAAERAETAGRAGDALAIYADLLGRVRDPSQRAVLLARTARLHQRLGDLANATQAWGTLVRDYPDTYDLAQRPFAVVATLELARLGAGQQAVTDVRRDLAAARWAISPGQADYFAAEFDRASRAAMRWDETRLFDQFALARAVRTHLAAVGAPPPGGLRPLTIATGMRGRQVFQASLDIDNREPLVVSVEVDLPWIRKDVLPRVARELAPTDAGPDVRMMPVTSDPSVFRNLLPFVTLVVEAPRRDHRWWRSELFAFGGTIAGVLLVLVLGIVLVMRDVSRDAALAQVRSDLVSGVSHELKTPLSVIRLYAESLVDDFGNSHPGAEHSRIILHESERLTHLVQRVLDFSTLDDDRATVVPDVHAPVALVQGFVDRYRAYLSHLGFEPRTEFQRDLPDIRVDAAALTQALVNLVDNAVKYSGEARTLMLRVVAGPMGHVAIEVEDRGVGIDPAERLRVLEPFYRTRRTLGRGGYGLGLHLVARIMEAHGGAIEIHTPADGGTCVRLVFPSVPPAGEE